MLVGLIAGIGWLVLVAMLEEAVACVLASLPEAATMVGAASYATGDAGMLTAATDAPGLKTAETAADGDV